MSERIAADQLLAQLKKWKVPYREIDGWRTRGRDAATGKPFGPVFGCVTHHTGDDAPDTADRNVIINGRPDLPGPLAQFGLNDDGVVDLISVHRCNHAGGGDARVLEAVKAESYGDYPTATHQHEGSAGAVDGNDCFYGVETYYSGGKAPTAAAYKSLVLLWAALCDFHDWSAKSVIGHKEWSDWKVDPGHVDMKVLRADVQKALDAAHQPKPTLFPVAHRVVTANMFVSNPDPVRGVMRIIDRATQAFKYQPDAIAMQETHHMLGKLEKVGGYELLYADEGEAGRELAVLLNSKLAATARTEFHPTVPGVGSGAFDHPRGIFIVKYTKRKRKVAIVNTHAPVFGEDRMVDGAAPGPAAVQHSAHSQKVVNTVARLKANGYTVFVCADANSRGRWPESLPVLLEAAGLKVVRDNVDLVAMDPAQVKAPETETVDRRLTGSDHHDAIAIRTTERKHR